MRRYVLCFCFCFLVAPAWLLAVADFARYDVILERRPFGTPVEEPVAIQVSDEPPAFVQALRLVAITESPAGIRVGFLDTKPRPARTYFLYVGEDEDGIVLLDADYDGERALVSKDGEQYWMQMGTITTGHSSPETRSSSARDPGGRRDSRADRVGVIRSTGDSGTKPPDSYAERRRQRIAEMRRRAEASRQLSEEEVERQLREYQMRLIREGRTPLPIPITEEMDAQLVAEGILPSVE